MVLMTVNHMVYICGPTLEQSGARGQEGAINPQKLKTLVF